MSISSASSRAQYASSASRPLQQHHPSPASPSLSSSQFSSSAYINSDRNDGSMSSRGGSANRDHPSGERKASGSSLGPGGGIGGGLSVPGTGGDSRAIAKIHWEALQVFLEDFLKREPPNSRQNAREKLTRLTKQQFSELATDVYDELSRRTANAKDVPYLPTRTDFHPKRNQARQKLATLPKNRFKDLGGDVYTELDRRYPEFSEPEEVLEPTPIREKPNPINSSKSNNHPSSFSTRQSPSHNQNPSSSSKPGHNTRSSSNSYDEEENPFNFIPAAPSSSASSAPRTSLDRTNNSNPYTLPPRSVSRQSSDQQAQAQAMARRGSNAGSTTSTNDFRGGPQQPHPSRQQQQPPSNGSSSFQQQTSRPPGSSSRPRTLSNGSQPSAASSPSRSHFPFNQAPHQPSNASASSSPPPHQNNPSSSSNSNVNNLEANSFITSNLVANKSTIAEEIISVPYARDSMPSPGLDSLGSPKPDSVYYDRMSFGSAVSRGGQMPGGGGGGNTAQLEREKEELKRDYEYQIATLTAKLTGLLSSHSEHAESISRETEKREEAEEEISRLREDLDVVRRELDEVRGELRREREKVEDAERQRMERELEFQRELESAREETKRERSQADSGSSHPPSKLLTDLKSQIIDLVNELTSLSHLNDSLQRERDFQRETVTASEAKARDMERKWKSVKTELRNLKATSQTFVSAPRTDDHFPATRNGALADTHMTAFQSSINTLITAARSPTPTSVLSAMKPVIHALSSISSDVQTFEARPASHRSHVDPIALASLKDRSTTSLTTLTQRAREFAMSYGLSPVGLLDVAAGDLSGEVVGLVKLLGIRRAEKSGEMGMGESGDAVDEETAAGRSMSSETGYSNGSSTSHSTQVSSSFNNRSHSPTSSSSSSSTTGYNNNNNNNPYDPSTLRNSNSTARNQPASSSFPPSSRGGPFDAPDNYRHTATSSIGSAFDLERKPSVANTAFESVGGGEDEEELKDHQMRRDSTDDEEQDGDSAWNELKPYLDTQSTSLLQSIQTLLTSLRSPPSASSSSAHIYETLSQVIVLGSSIVGVSKDALPRSSLAEGRRLLREVAGCCERLSECGERGRDGREDGKEWRNEVAGTTFELVRNLKSLMNL